GQVAVLGEAALFARHAGAALAGDLTAPFRVHRGKATSRAGGFVCTGFHGGSVLSRDCRGEGAACRRRGGRHPAGWGWGRAEAPRQAWPLARFPATEDQARCWAVPGRSSWTPSSGPCVTVE